MSFHMASRILLQLVLLRGVFSLLSNRTVDDQFGDEVTGLTPSYSPAAGWRQGANCSECLIQARPIRAQNGTWHDATHRPGDSEPRVVSVSFNGTAVYAYCILANKVAFADTITNLTFTLDGQHVGSFVHTPGPSARFLYNVPVYTNNSLSNGPHTFTLETVAAVNPSLILFDYVTYSTEADLAESSSRTSSSSPTATHTSSSRSNRSATIGGAVGGGSLIVGIVICTVILIRRKRQRQRRPEVEPFLSEPTYHQEGSGVGFNTLNGRSHRQLSMSEHTLLSHPPSVTTESNVAASNFGTTGAPSAHISEGAHMTLSRGARAKQAMRQEEMFQQVQEMEQTVANLRARRQHSATTRRSTISTGSLATLPEIGGENDAHLLEQIDTLHREVERLRTEQRQMMWEMQDVPPPVYT